MSNKQTCTRCEGEIARDVEIERLRTFEAAIRSWVESGLRAVSSASRASRTIREMSCRCPDCKGKGVIEVTP